MLAALESQAVQPILLRPREAAVLLGVSERTLWTLQAEGHIKPTRVKRQLRYSRQELERFAREGTGA